MMNNVYAFLVFALVGLTQSARQRYLYHGFCKPQSHRSKCAMMIGFHSDNILQWIDMCTREYFTDIWPCKCSKHTPNSFLMLSLNISISSNLVALVQLSLMLRRENEGWYVHTRACSYTEVLEPVKWHCSLALSPLDLTSLLDGKRSWIVSKPVINSTRKRLPCPEHHAVCGSPLRVRLDNQLVECWSLGAVSSSCFHYS